jgi:DNA-directed RNA polymerase subunit beta'
MLNRAPTLHRLGIQAFEPKLIEGKAIQLHPLVCAAFNADFDGDQMAVHVPLSLEAQLEARVLMMSTNNILSPANGKPIIVPSQDIILGLYYITYERGDAVGPTAYVDSAEALAAGIERHDIILTAAGDRLKVLEENDPKKAFKLVQDGKAVAHRVPLYASMAEIEHAMAEGAITLQTRIKTIFETVDADGEAIEQRVITTPGRMMLANILPKHPNVPFSLINKLLTKKEITNLIDIVYRHCGQKETVIFCDQLMNLGFGWACRSASRSARTTCWCPRPRSTLLIDEAQEQVKEYEQQYLDGLITQGEKYNKVVDRLVQHHR